MHAECSARHALSASKTSTSGAGASDGLGNNVSVAILRSLLKYVMLHLSSFVAIDTGIASVCAVLMILVVFKGALL